MITGMQIRAARALLGWSQEMLADAAGVSLPTIKRIEARGNAIGGRATTVETIQSAVEQAGIVFLDDDEDGGRGVRLGRRDRSGVKA